MYLTSLWPNGRYCLLACLAVIISCGGGSTLVSLPGTGGTGAPVLSYGNITGFGSVIVNGVRFDDTNATVRLDGIDASSDQLALGMRVGVTGLIDSATATTATATAIHASSIALGTVSNKTTTGFSVAGMHVTVDDATVYGGTLTFAALADADQVKVWGVNSKSDYSAWSASRIEWANTATTVISSGLVSQAAGRTALNGYTLTGAISGLAHGQAATVMGSEAAGVLTVTSVRIIGTTPTVAVGTRLEREGVITAVHSTTSFQIGAYRIDASQATVLPAGAVIAVGARAEVNGVWNGTGLAARKVELKTVTQRQEVEAYGTITSFTDKSDFVVRGLRCDASTLTAVSGGTFANLKVGAIVSLHGSNQGNTVKVTELEIRRP